MAWIFFPWTVEDVIPIVWRMLFPSCGGCYSNHVEDVIPIVWRMLFPDKATYRSSMPELRNKHVAIYNYNYIDIVLRIYWVFYN